MNERKKRKLLSIMNDYNGCTRCELHEGRTNVVFGCGSSNARVAVIGGSPSHEDDESGRPFYEKGPQGALMHRYLKGVGLEPGDVYMDNVVACRGSKPLAKHIKACSDRLHRSIEAIDPIIIVRVGPVALRAFTKKAGPFRDIGGSRQPRLLSTATRGIHLDSKRPGFAIPSMATLIGLSSMVEGSPRHRAFVTLKAAVSFGDEASKLYGDR